ncbi:hypothetical protein HSBAA_45330 [Vreelandella sulfidaeris]|uniref:GGDEF domain-containing protein n=1 Tax=Vreelandella sulfidaeris TaxID=115553 RepID=A0A455UC89_9GAMM|nr:hypothetical protein HSBAA_45330 [Halomonas sulfidaeris]
MQDKGAVLPLDLDQFKEVNELNGHHVGDRLLREVAETLSLNLGHRGVIARLGGDEFSLLLKDMDAEQAVAIAQYIVQLLKGSGLEQNNNGCGSPPVSASPFELSSSLVYGRR